MKTSLVFCLLISILFITCKKESKPVTYNITGNWTLAAYQTNFGIGVNATATLYPCMNDNILTFYSDNTASQTYLGTDTCFITPTHLRANGAQTSGLPNSGAITSTWSVKGNLMLLTYAGDTKPIRGVISTVNNKLQITLKDTVVSGGATYYITTVEVKQ